jgi:Protein of unknown function (DUF3768)
MSENNNERIAALNDTFRRTFAGGKVLMTAGVAALPDAAREQVVHAVRSFETFEAGDDPYGEHDFGAVEIASEKFFWKIDYYDKAMNGGSEDPANPARTTRVLTIMLADEY